MSNNTMSIIARQLQKKSTIKNMSARRLNATDIGDDNFTNWKNAMVKANFACYNYLHALDLRAHKMDVNIKAKEQTAYDSIKAIFDMVGEVSDRDMILDKAMFGTFATYAVREATELAGSALTVNSQIKNLEKELDKPMGGVNPEWIKAKNEELANKRAELAMLTKMTDSSTDVDKRVGDETFRGKVEKRIAKLINDQCMKSAEQIDAERAAAKALHKAQKKAQRQAEAEARKKAEAQAK